MRVGVVTITIAITIVLGAILCQPGLAQPEFVSLDTAEIAVDGGLSRGVAFGDYDGDGRPDLLVANTIGQPELLYRNAGGGDFLQVHEVAPTLSGGWSEGVNWIDVDNDGDLDLFVVRTQGGHRLYRNEAGELVPDEASGLAASGVPGSMACWGDLDGDGWLDVFIANRQGQHDALYRNLDGVRFERQWRGPAVNSGGDGRACALGDADGDGDLDL